LSASTPAAAAHLFADIVLAARIERAECRLVAAGAAVVAQRHPECEVLVRPLRSGQAVLGLPGSPLNKLLGLGFEAPLDAAGLEELAELERLGAARGLELSVEVSTLADPAVGEALGRRGYLLKGFENVLGRRLGPPGSERPAPLPAGMSIELVDAARFDLWVDTFITGMLAAETRGVPSHQQFERAALEPVLVDFASIGQMRNYLVRWEGRAAGGASVRFTDGVCQLCGASTLPEFRRRGIQAALLARRLGDAATAGCDLAVVTTRPGSQSMQNVQRQGFELLYARAVWLREA